MLTQNDVTQVSKPTAPSATPGKPPAPKEKKSAPDRPALGWGLSPTEFLAGLRDKPIKITTMDHKLYQGVFVGLGQWELVLRRSNGQLFLMHKHAIKLIEPDVPGSGNGGASTNGA